MFSHFGKISRVPSFPSLHPYIFAIMDYNINNVNTNNKVTGDVVQLQNQRGQNIGAKVLRDKQTKTFRVSG